MGNGPHDQKQDLTAAAEHVWSKLSQEEQINFNFYLTALLNEMSSGERQRFSYLFIIDILYEGTQKALKNIRSFILRHKSQGLSDYLQFQRKLMGCPTACEDTSTTVGQTSESIPLEIWVNAIPVCQVFKMGVPFPQGATFHNSILNKTLNPESRHSCSSSPFQSLQKPWSPAEYQIHNVPLVYLNGESDAQTGIKWALEGYDAQRTTSKVFVRVQDGGHAVIHDGGILAPCADFFFRKLLSEDLASISAKAVELGKFGCSAVHVDAAP